MINNFSSLLVGHQLMSTIKSGLRALQIWLKFAIQLFHFHLNMFLSLNTVFALQYHLLYFPNSFRTQIEIKNSIKLFIMSLIIGSVGDFLSYSFCSLKWYASRWRQVTDFMNHCIFAQPIRSKTLIHLGMKQHFCVLLGNGSLCFYLGHICIGWEKLRMLLCLKCSVNFLFLNGCIKISHTHLCRSESARLWLLICCIIRTHWDKDWQSVVLNISDYFKNIRTHCEGVFCYDKLSSFWLWSGLDLIIVLWNQNHAPHFISVI